MNAVPIGVKEYETARTRQFLNNPRSRKPSTLSEFDMPFPLTLGLNVVQVRVAKLGIPMITVHGVDGSREHCEVGLVDAASIHLYPFPTALQSDGAKVNQFLPSLLNVLVRLGAIQEIDFFITPRV